MLSRFPEYEDTIKVLYHFDDEFKSLCEDYFTTRMNAEKFKIRATENRVAESEYKSLSKTLEQEIIEYIGSRK